MFLQKWEQHRRDDINTGISDLSVFESVEMFCAEHIAEGGLDELSPSESANCGTFCGATFKKNDLLYHCR